VTTRSVTVQLDEGDQELHIVVKGSLAAVDDAMSAVALALRAEAARQRAEVVAGKATPCRSCGDGHA